MCGGARLLSFVLSFLFVSFRFDAVGTSQLTRTPERPRHGCGEMQGELDSCLLQVRRTHVLLLEVQGALSSLLRGKGRARANSLTHRAGLQRVKRLQ